LARQAAELSQSLTALCGHLPALPCGLQVAYTHLPAEASSSQPLHPVGGVPNHAPINVTNQSLVADVSLVCCLLVLQGMKKSQVCGGFWLSAAAPLPRHLQHPGEKGVLLAFSRTDETRPADTFRSKAYQVRGKQWQPELFLGGLPEGLDSHQLATHSTVRQT
jgi:hypothetical protein